MVKGSTTRYLTCAILLIGVYAGSILYRGAQNEKDEIFPVFQWELFSKVPDRVRADYSFRLTAVDGTALFVPRYYEDAAGLVADPRAVEASTLARSTGSALSRGDEPLATERRRVFEDRFLAGKSSVDYELVRRTYDIKHRFECRCFEDEEVVGTYELRRGS